jgi:hypothetical protein
MTERYWSIFDKQTSAVNLGQMPSTSIKEWAEKRLINLLELQP